MISPTSQRMQQKIVLKVVAKFFIPFILLFGLYVQFHGDFGPGGGFQAGVIFAAAFILHGIIFGLEAIKKAVTPRSVEIGAALGVLLYAAVGVYSLVVGGNFLDYDLLNPAHPSHGQHLGILLVELGVGITVFSTMTLLFYAFAGRPRA